MSPADIQPIVLAAGKGTRMGQSAVPKVLTPVHGRPLIAYALDALREAGFLPPAIVVGHGQEAVRHACGPGYTYIEQAEQRGTGHAVRVCGPVLRGRAPHHLVLYGDHALWSVETLARLAARHRETGAAVTLTALRTDHPAFHGSGRVLRGADGRIAGIRELRDCSPAEAAIEERNVGLYCFADRWLWPALGRLAPRNVQGELYLTDLVELAVADRERVASIEAARWQEALGVNTPEQLADTARWLGEGMKG